jgi:hypothetical protein
MDLSDLVPMSHFLAYNLILGRKKYKVKRFRKYLESAQIYAVPTAILSITREFKHTNERRFHFRDSGGWDIQTEEFCTKFDERLGILGARTIKRVGYFVKKWHVTTLGVGRVVVGMSGE